MASLVPELAPVAGDLHFVLCDFGRHGTAYVETNPTEASCEAIVRNLIEGQYLHPLRVITLRPDGTWHDVSREIAAAVAAEAKGDELPEGTRDFLSAQRVLA
jgi:hypothetical protein